MTINQTDTWQTKPCGCRLQLSVWLPGEDDTRLEPMEMWVIRDQCQPHAEESELIMSYLREYGFKG